jgi:hypothetical protein
MTYTTPKITELGSVRDFTLALSGFNKIGQGSDIHSALTGLVGSIVPAK